MQITAEIKRLMFSLLCGCTLTLASITHNVELAVVDAEIYRLGFPMYWLQMGRSTWFLELSPWIYQVAWDSLVGDIIFWTILAFALITVLTTQKYASERSL